MLKTIMAICADADNYSSRKVARDDVRGLSISTAFTSDCGYETAVIDANGVHPVQRYSSKEESEDGHKSWLKKAKTIKKITKLGDADGWCDSKTITLKRKK